MALRTTCSAITNERGHTQGSQESGEGVGSGDDGGMENDGVENYGECGNRRWGQRQWVENGGVFVYYYMAR